MDSHKKQFIFLVILVSIFVIIFILSSSDMIIRMEFFRDNDCSSILYSGYRNEWLKYLINSSEIFPAITDIRINKICLNDTNIVIIIITAAKNLEARNSIRQTYGMNIALHNRISANKISLYFLVGISDEQYAMENILAEDKKYHDIIQFNIVEQYENIIIKYIAMLRWFTEYCYIAKYLVKTDDDIYVNVEYLKRTDIFPTDTNSSFIRGMHIGTRVLRNTKWAMPVEVYSCNQYPDYVPGIGYILSGSAIQSLYSATIFLIEKQTKILETNISDIIKSNISRIKYPVIRYEDVVINGIAREYANITLIKDRKIVFIKSWYHDIGIDIKKDTLFIGHYFKPKDLKVIHDLISNNDNYISASSLEAELDNYL